MGGVDDITGHLKKLKIGITDDTSVHRLNRLYCVIFFILLAVFSSTKQYVGEPISCWCPAMFKKFHVAYANTYCWIKNTYSVSFDETLPSNVEDREENEILYYQWVPLIFAFQAFLFYAPRMFWKRFCGYSGLDLKKALIMANSATYCDPKEREEIVSHLAVYLDKWIDIRDCIVARHNKVKKVKETMAARGLHYGNYIAVLHIFTDILFLFNAIGQIFLVDVLLGNEFRNMGPDFFGLIFKAKKWEDLGRFPLVSYCDFDIRQLQNLQTWTVQCSLPINLFNEKMFVCVWFLLVAMSAINGVYLIYNMITFFIPWRKFEYVKKYLTLSMPKHFATSEERAREISSLFVNDFLKNDGVYVIWLVSHNTSSIVAAELVDQLWSRYCDRPYIREKLKIHSYE